MLSILAPRQACPQNQERTAMASHYAQIAYSSDNTDTIRRYARMAYDIASKNADPALLDSALNVLAYSYTITESYDTAIMFYKRHYLLISETDDKFKIAKTLANLGICYKKKGKFIDMWDNLQQSNDIFKELGDTANICWTTLALGESYEHFGMYSQANEHYSKTLTLAKAAGDDATAAECYYNIAHSQLAEINSHQATHLDELRLFSSLEYLKRADKIASQTMPRHMTIIELAKCYSMLADETGNGSYTDSCRLMLERLDDMPPIKTTRDSLEIIAMKAGLLIKSKKFKDAIAMLKPSSDLPTKADYTKELATINKMLSECYKATGKIKDAYFAKKKYSDLATLNSNEENMRRTANFAARTEIDLQRKKHLTETQRRIEAEEKEKQRENTMIKSVAFGLAGAIIITLLIIYHLQRNRSLGKELATRNDKLITQRDIIEQQKDDEQKAQEIILSSLDYAFKLQSQAIGNKESLAATFPESFVYYRPRNIVSGDWYMATTLKGHRIMVEADCTGHGIPGALLSMLGVSSLKEIINQIRHTDTEILPGRILDEMRTSVKKALNKNTKDAKGNIDDGMDMTIIAITPENDRLLFGSANQSAIFVSDGKATRLKGDANPIGNYVREKDHFTTTTIDIKPGDAIYLCSDGIQDQIGGDEERKYSFKTLMTFLEEHYTLPMHEQETTFEHDFDAYTGLNDQVDDRTLIGIRI